MPSRENVLRASSGADLRVFDHQQANKPKRSRFDLSRITNFTCDSGMILPFDWFETVPGDSFDLSTEVAIESLPTITSVLTPYHVRTYWFYCRNSDLWAGWETFVTRGRSGNVDLRLPLFNPDKDFVDTDDIKWTWSIPHSLQSYLGCLPKYGKNIVDTNYASYLSDFDSYCAYSAVSSLSVTGYVNPAGGVSALPFMMYQNICKYYFVDENLLQGNTALFPEQGDSDWRLPYSFDSSGYVDTVAGTTLSIAHRTGVYSASDNYVLLGALRYAMFEEDYFTSGLPWLQRGASRTLDFDIDFSDIDATFTGTSLTGVITYPSSGYTQNFSGTEINLGTHDSATGFRPLVIPSARSTDSGHVTSFVPNGNVVLSAPGGIGTSITANQLRELIAYSVWQERNARVDGSYNAMIWVHFSENPKSPEHQARYIGGTSSYINFSEIYQQSESGDTPLGTVSARGSLYETQHYH